MEKGFLTRRVSLLNNLTKISDKFLLGHGSAPFLAVYTKRGMLARKRRIPLVRIADSTAAINHPTRTDRERIAATYPVDNLWLREVL
jgi:hypothetical protein